MIGIRWPSTREELYFHARLGRDTVRNFQVALDTIYLCGMEGVDWTGWPSSDGYRISVWAYDDLPYVGRVKWFHGSITLEGVTSLPWSKNEPAGGLKLFVPARLGLTCDDAEVLTADAGSPENLVVEAHYGLGISSVRWPVVTGATGYKVQWEQAFTGTRFVSAQLGSTSSSYDLVGKYPARWVRVAAVTSAGEAWSAALVPPNDDPLQVWFTANSPSLDLIAGRVVMQPEVSRGTGPPDFDNDGDNDINLTCSIIGGGGSGSISCRTGSAASLADTGKSEVKVVAELQDAATDVVVEIASNVAAATEAGGPNPPEAWASGGNGRLRVDWTEPSARAGQVGSISGYIVQLRSRTEVGAGSWSTWADTNKAATDRSHTFTGLEEGTYQVRVRAKTDGDDGDSSTTDTERLGATSTVRTVVVHAANSNLPGAPGSSVAVGNRKLTVTWQRPNPDTGSLVHGYTVRHKQSGAADSAYVETKVYPRPGLASGSLEITGLTADTAYVVQIRSHNANGDSPWATIGGTHTVGPVTLVSNLLISPGGGIQFSNNPAPAQAFTTGSNPGGYKLTGVDLILTATDAANYSVGILAESSGNPGAVVGTLDTSSTTASANRARFSSSASGGGIDLDADTTYFVRPTFTSHTASTRWNNTLSDGESGLEGFTIANSGVGVNNNQSYNMAIYGYPK